MLCKRLLVLVLLSLLITGLAFPIMGQQNAGKKYALLVGVKDYQHNKLPSLRYTENDVLELAKVLQQGNYEVTLLCDMEGKKDAERGPSRANIDKHLKELLRKCQRTDSIVVAFSGHGLQFEGQRDCFFCPADARPFADETGTMVSLTAVYEEMEKSFAGVQILLVDACRNDPKLERAARGINADTAPRPPRGVAAMFSCSAGEFAFEHTKYQHGVFFYHVLEGLRGKAKNVDGNVTFNSLADYVNGRVATEVPVLIGQGAKQSPNQKADLSGASPVLMAMTPKSVVNANIQPKKPLVKKTESIDLENSRIARDQSWKGQMVMYTKDPKDIKFGDRVDGKQIYFPFSGAIPTQVRDEREGWLRIYDGQQEGWADKADFVLARDAPAFFHKLVQDDPNNFPALFMRGMGWHLKGEYDNAIKDFDEVIRLKPTVSMCFVARGNAYYSKKEYDKVIRDCDEAIRLDPQNSQAYSIRGNSWSAKENYDRAIRDFDEAIRLDPKNTFAFAYRGNAWKAKKEYDRALRDFDEYLRLDPKNPWGHYVRSVTQLLNRRPQAVTGFQKVLDLEGWKGQWLPYAVILGHLAARQAGDEISAARFLRDSAGRLGETWPLPVIRFLQGEIDEAALLELAIDNDKRTEARCYLAMDHALKGRKDDATAHFRWVKDNGNTNFTEYIIAVAELERLER